MTDLYKVFKILVASVRPAEKTNTDIDLKNSPSSTISFCSGVIWNNPIIFVRNGMSNLIDKRSISFSRMKHNKAHKISCSRCFIPFYKSHFSAIQNFAHYSNQRWAQLRFFEIQTEPKKRIFKISSELPNYQFLCQKRLSFNLACIIKHTVSECSFIIKGLPQEWRVR
jgi:hypothetical protein